MQSYRASKNDFWLFIIGRIINQLLVLNKKYYYVIKPRFLDLNIEILGFYFYHFPTENFHLKKWVGHGPMSRWELNDG
ncbi:hypothetical protein [Bacillus wiedmannii]|uniref:hypothetical protein n=1 Tax=Bacillus wiedmannii TaxID=1890302 RepID=UPI001E5D33A6|nr:hypothetical protein [Bacillus wiedmannii]